MTNASDLKHALMTFEEIMHDYEIEIPLIQREYAQGRNDNNGREIRKKFIPVLIDAILKSDKGLTLDFVFGIVKNRKEDNLKPLFIPLDGQQRLTTLFLLYWYFGKIGSQWTFRYKSRRIADSFVKELIKDKNWDRVALNQKPSVWIRNQAWFFENWLTDPTVFGMLTMLDAIHELTHHIEAETYNLNAIHFYLYPIESIDADSTYTKMNARGEPLTDWENIKSLLDKRIREFCHLSSQCHSDNCNFLLWSDYIDGNWLQMLEEHCGITFSQAEDTELEQDIVNINTAFRTVIDLAIAIDLAKRTKTSIKELEAKNRVRLFLAHDAMLSDYGISFTQNAFNLAFTFFETISSHDCYNSIKNSWPQIRSENALWGAIPTNEIAKDTLKMFLLGDREQFTYSNSARFYALVRYYSSSTNNVRLITRILNLLDNTDINVENFTNIILGIDSLFSNGISLNTLSKLKGFSSHQIEEELLKIGLDFNDFFELEKHPLLYGSIGFLWDGVTFNQRWIDIFNKYLTLDQKKWDKKAFNEKLITFYPENICADFFVPFDNSSNWLKLLKQQDARNAFKKMVNYYTISPQEDYIQPQWVVFYKSLIENYGCNITKISKRGDIVYGFQNNCINISSNAICLSYTYKEKCFLKNINPPFVYYGRDLKISTTMLSLRDRVSVDVVFIKWADVRHCLQDDESNQDHMINIYCDGHVIKQMPFSSLVEITRSQTSNNDT